MIQKLGKKLFRKFSGKVGWIWRTSGLISGPSVASFELHPQPPWATVSQGIVGKIAQVGESC